MNLRKIIVSLLAVTIVCETLSGTTLVDVHAQNEAPEVSVSTDDLTEAIE